MQVQLLPDALIKQNNRPVRLSVQDTSLSRWQGGFNSRTGHFDNTQKHDQVVQLVDTRRSERRAHSGLGVRLSPWSFVIHCRRGWRPTGSHKAGHSVQFRGLQLGLQAITTQVGQRSVKAHNLRQSGATPEPATLQPSTQTGKAATTTAHRGGARSLAILSVRLRSRLLHDPVVQWRRRLGDIQKIDGSNPSGVIFQRSVGVSGARRFGKAEDRVQFPDGPLREKKRESGPSSNGKTSAWHAENSGSTPGGSI